MSEREYGGYPESALRQGWFQLEDEQCIAIVTDLLNENAALRSELRRLRDVVCEQDVESIDAALAGQIGTSDKGCKETDIIWTPCAGCETTEACVTQRVCPQRSARVHASE